MSDSSEPGATTRESPWAAARERLELQTAREVSVVDAAPDRERDFFAVVPRGVEDLVLGELEELGAREVQTTAAGASFRGTKETAYRACLWSRYASRILLPLATFPAADSDGLYRGVAAVAWEEQMHLDSTFAVGVKLRNAVFDHSQFVALRTKDAIVDRFRQRRGARPGIDLEQPDLSVYCFVDGDQATVGIDLSGAPLHRRGYRVRGVAAPLKENLAAALLARAGWPRLAAAGWSLLDPMCGSGTLVIEAAWMAADRAPGLGRESFGFEGWLGHHPQRWSQLREEARARYRRGRIAMPGIAGSDSSPEAVEAARQNVEAAELGEQISLRVEGVSLAAPPTGADHGLLITNPPWGQRLGGGDGLDGLYGRLGERLREAFDGWQASILGPDEDLLREVGLRWYKVNKLYHGPLPCRLAHYRIGRRPRAGEETATDGPSDP